MSKELSIISKDLSKARPSDIEQIYKTLLKKVEDGELSAIEVKAKLKPYEIVIEKITEDKGFKAKLASELEAYGIDGKVSGNVKLTIGTTSRNDFSNDPVWKSLQEQMKEREGFLKNLPSSGATAVDESTGEEYKVYPPVKKVSSVIKGVIV